MLSKRILTPMLLVLLLKASPGVAMQHLTLTCDACNYRAELEEGSLKQLFLTTGLGIQPFFCRSTKRFVSLKVILEPRIFKNSKKAIDKEDVARETKIPVSKDSKVYLYTHPSCRDALVPLPYYTERKDSVCPICNKGRIKIEEGAISD